METLPIVAEVAFNDPKTRPSFVYVLKSTVVVGSATTPENSTHLFSDASLTNPECWYVPLLNAATKPKSSAFD